MIQARLGGDPNASRADDLRVAASDLADGAAAAMPADWVVDGDRPVEQVVDEVLGRLGWLGISLIPDDRGRRTVGYGT